VGEWFGHESGCTGYKTDAKTLVRGSEIVCDVRGVLILHEDVATVPADVSSARKKTELLFFLAETVRERGSFCCWAGLAFGLTPGLLLGC
jgi:hypothetical protein